jgi:hypothetical protein
MRGNRVNNLFTILEPGQTYRGLSLGQWVVQLTNWMVSEDPVKQEGPVFFTRGTGVADNKNLEIYHREGNDGLVIDTDQAVLLQIISSTADNHFYPDLKTDADLREEVRGDINGTSFDSIYADYSVDGGASWKPVIDPANSDFKFTDYVVETPLFRLDVPKTEDYKARIWDDVELKEEFRADAVTVGVFLMLTNFEEGYYKFRFGAVGDGTYYTSSVYDISVNDSHPTHIGGMRKTAPFRPVFMDHPVWGKPNKKPQPLI